MKTPFVLVITGPPAAGKTTLGRKLTVELEIPFVSSDDIKEILFDTLGWKDREWSKTLGRVSLELLFYYLECELRVGKSVIVETAFVPELHTRRFLELKDRYGCLFFQVYCTADDEVLYDRFHERVEGGKRHPGHVDQMVERRRFEEAMRQRRYGKLEIGGMIFELDTTDFGKMNDEGLRAAIRSVRQNRAKNDPAIPD